MTTEVKAMGIERLPDGSWQLVEYTILKTALKQRVTSKPIGTASTIEVAVGRMPQECYRLFFPK